jgi:hypothetical protein
MILDALEHPHAPYGFFGFAGIAVFVFDPDQ